MKPALKTILVLAVVASIGFLRSEGAHGMASPAVLDTWPPDSITDLTATMSATTRTVTLSWSVPSDVAPGPRPGMMMIDVAPAGYDLRYSTSPITTDVDFAAAVQASGEPSGQAYGGRESMNLALPAWGTTYYFAIKSYDSANQSPLSDPNPSAVTPLDSIPPAAILLNLTMSPSNASATLTWNAPADNTGAVVSYDLRYAIQEITDDGNPALPTDWNNATPATGEPTVPKAPGIGETMEVSLPDGGTTYFFAIESRDAAGNWSPLSNVVSGTTPGVSSHGGSGNGGGSGSSSAGCSATPQLQLPSFFCLLALAALLSRK